MDYVLVIQEQNTLLEGEYMKVTMHVIMLY